MRSFSLKKNFFIAALFTLAVPALTAQQITYYDFNAPQADPTQYSYSCGASLIEAVGNGPTSTPLFCFNDATGQNANPSFVYDFYPPAIDPTGGSGSSQYAIQTTPASGYQGQSLWFSVPQKVANGFTTWFAFKITPNGTTADGLAFVIQNALGGGSDSDSGCAEQGSGQSVVGGEGGCMAYGGIDNSVALEFDTYQNTWDSNNNHIALQSCGAGIANSPDHGTCNVNLVLNDTSIPALVTNPTTSTANPTPVTIADGNVHQVVVIYNGPNDTPANYLYVYLDPPFVAGTHTPDPTQGATPLFQGSYTLTNSVNPLTSGTGNDSAYVGFTSATGSFFEQHELMAWTFTSHSSVPQVQPLAAPGSPTTFYFGSFDFSVTYPVGGPSTSGISMAVTANTISPANFTALLGMGATQFTGTQCQVFDDTGGNCIIFSAACVYTATLLPVACPTTISTPYFINLTTSYDNSAQPISPGLLQGDPFYTAINSISGDGSTATVTCGTPLSPGGQPFGECSVTAGQTVTIFGAQPAGFNGTFTVTSVPAPNTFTYASGVDASSTVGGYLTSNNVQNIFTSYSPENLDGTSAGRTKSFSDFSPTAVTVVGSQTQVTANTLTPIEGAPDLITATITASTGDTPGPGSMPTGTIPPIAPSTVNFYTGPSNNLTPIPGCSGVLVTPTSATTGTATCSYTPGATGAVTVTAQYSDAYHLPSSGSVNLNVAPPFDAAIKLTFGSTMLTYPGTTTETVCVTPATSAPATGTVQLFDGSTLLKALKLSNSCAKWSISPPLAVGIHTMTASYSGDTNNPAGNSAPVTVTVSAAKVLMIPACGPPSLPYGDNYQCAVAFVYNLGLAKGVMTYTLDGGAPVNVTLNSFGIANFTITNPALGIHHVVLNYAAQGNFSSAGPVTETFNVTVAPVKVSLTASPNSAKQGKTVTLTAKVTSSCAPPPTSGTVSFYIGSTLLTTVSVNGSGVATYSTTTLPVGKDTIKATYNGSPNYGTASASVTVTISR